MLIWFEFSFPSRLVVLPGLDNLVRPIYLYVERDKWIHTFHKRINARRNKQPVRIWTLLTGNHYTTH